MQGAAAAASGDDEGSGSGSEGGVGGGNWAAVKDASIRLGKSASRKGLARVASLVTEAGSGRASSSSPQQQEAQGQAVRQIPVIEQQPDAEQARQQQQPRQIPVIDMSQAPEQQQQQQDRQRQEQQQQQQEEQQEEQGRDVVLPYSCGFDNPMAEAAVAQEASVADRRAAQLAAPGGGNGGPGDPEHLFPPGAQHLHNNPMCSLLASSRQPPLSASCLHMPRRCLAFEAVMLCLLRTPAGRIIWIFPADEDLDASAVEDAIPPGQAEQQLEAMDFAWQGVAEGSQEPQGLEGEAAQMVQEQPQQGQGAGGTGGSRERYQLTNAAPAEQGLGAVNMEEAVQAVEAGGSQGPGSGSGAAGAPAAPPAGSAAEQPQQGQQQQRRRVAVAVDADRGSFERLLLLPDMLSDHVPDRYCQALQQL